VTNWRAYDASLRQRGGLTVWFGDEATEGWKADAFSPNDARVLTASWGEARLWEAAAGREIAQISLDAGASALAVSGGAIALGDTFGRIHVFDYDALLTARGPSCA
jgi:hypothetical protein